MKIRVSQLPASRLDMTPMIDVVFQLMIFFMLTLKIVTTEGNFDIYMPLGPSCGLPDPTIPEIKVRLVAAPNGQLARVELGRRNLGSGPEAIDRLNGEILRISQINEAPEVEIDADYNLDYAHVVRAISACTGTVDPRTGELVRYVQRIRFAPPRRAA
jgi:biopolymer transport protein ExbD